MSNQKPKLKPQLNDTTLHVPDWQKIESQKITSVVGEVRTLKFFLLECQLIGYFRDQSGHI